MIIIIIDFAIDIDIDADIDSGPGVTRANRPDWVRVVCGGTEPMGPTPSVSYGHQLPGGGSGSTICLVGVVHQVRDDQGCARADSRTFRCAPVTISQAFYKS